MTETYEAIFHRKAIRKYDQTPLSSERLESIGEVVNGIEPLFKDAAFDWKIVDAKGIQSIFSVKAPHYLSFSSEDNDRSRMNLGFVFQHLDLYLSANGLGSCWLGFTKPNDSSLLRYPFQASLAFGLPAENLHRQLTEFRRKPLSEISRGEDKRLQAVSLAPSAHNTQAWYFISEQERLHCYQTQPPILANLFLRKLTAIDMGIALCHLAVASAHFGIPFALEQVKNPPAVENGTYIGTCRKTSTKGRT